MAKNVREREQKIIEQAYKRIPPEYHDFLILLDQQQCLSRNAPKEIPQEARQLGVWARNEAVYMPVRMPYMAVDGRVAMMVARQNGQPYSLVTEAEQINGEWYMRATFEGMAANGTPCKTIGRAKIGFGGKSVDSTNPVENAETSAVGRALAFAGYGLLGTGIASAEEVVTAKAESETQKAQPSRNEVRTESKKGTQNGGTITEQQLKKLFVMAREMNLNSDDMKYLMSLRYQKDSSKQLSKREAHDLIDYLQRLADGKEEWPLPEADIVDDIDDGQLGAELAVPEGAEAS